MATERLTLTQTPVQITDGTNSAHITNQAGVVVYADSENSSAWHVMERVLNIESPLAIWMKDENGDGAEITVTTYTAN